MTNEQREKRIKELTAKAEGVLIRSGGRPKKQAINQAKVYIEAIKFHQKKLKESTCDQKQ